MSADTPSLGEVILAAVAGELDGVRTGLPGVIQSYDPNTRRATVQALIADSFGNEEGARVSTPIPTLTDVPVLGIGAGTLRIKVPIKPGCPCWLSFSSSCIARLKATGKLEVHDPGDDRKHHEADVVATPTPSYAAEANDDTAQIEFTEDGHILAGGSQALLTAADAAALVSAISGAATAPSDGGAAFKANLLAALASWPTGTPKLRG